MLAYLTCLGKGKVPVKLAVDLWRMYDFTGARGAIVASVPGIHRSRR